MQILHTMYLQHAPFRESRMFKNEAKRDNTNVSWKGQIDTHCKNATKSGGIQLAYAAGREKEQSITEQLTMTPSNLPSATKFSTSARSKSMNPTTVVMVSPKRAKLGPAVPRIPNTPSMYVTLGQIKISSMTSGTTSGEHASSGL